MSDPKHREYESMADWIGLDEGEIFDPTDIGSSAEELNAMIDKVQSAYIEELFDLADQFLNDENIPEEVKQQARELMSQIFEP